MPVLLHQERHDSVALRRAPQLTVAGASRPFEIGQENPPMPRPSLRLFAAATAVEWGLADARAPAESLAAALDEFVSPLLRQTRTARRVASASR